MTPSMPRCRARGNGTCRSSPLELTSVSVPRVQVLYWQEIPSVLRVGDVKRQLPEWFQQEIDRVAMEQGLARVCGSRRQPRICPLAGSSAGAAAAS